MSYSYGKKLMIGISYNLGLMPSCMSSKFMFRVLVCCVTFFS